ncbi:MAG: TRAP transporter substrate-binding protein [Planctomycetaceae bacterium]|nr:TRAP transporter substrate-binding protein [Planctomycetaceae bacterium]
MIKKFLRAVVMAVLTLIVACGASARAGAPIELSFGHFWNPSHDLAVAVQKFKEAVEEKSDGRLIISVYPSSQLGTGREMMEQVVMGTLDIATGSISDWGTALNMPQLAAFELPFLYKNLESQKILIDGILGEKLHPMLEGTNLRHILSYANSVRNSIIKAKPIVTLEDFSGLKMRSPETKLFVQLFEGLGCNVVISPWAEVYTVLSQGVADAIEADAVGLVDMNLHEVAKFYTRTAHMGAIPVAFMNEQIWDSIPSDLQAIIMECAAENQKTQLANRQMADDKAEKALTDAGVVINDISDAERDRMRQAIMPIYDGFAKRYDMQELIDALLALEK